MQALPTFTESGGHLSVPARAGAIPITQSPPTPTALARPSIAQGRMLLRSRATLIHEPSPASPIVGIAFLTKSASPWYRRIALEKDSRGACPRGKTEEVMGTVIRTTTVVAA